MASVRNVDLGFFEGEFEPWDQTKEYEDWELESRHFPSKIGGHPAWLELAHLPENSVIECPNCKLPRKFLLQVYSPDEGVPYAFHRTIFVFICTSNECWSSSTSNGKQVLVLRSQLSRENEFYPAVPPEETAEWRTDIVLTKFGNVCPVCGCRGHQFCGQCKDVYYCGRAHQLMDWKAGHKKECKVIGQSREQSENHSGEQLTGQVSYGGPHAKAVLPEGLVDIEEEPNEGDGGGDGTNAEVLNKYKEVVEKGADGALHQEDEEMDTETDWNSIEENPGQDKASFRFKKRVERAPRQIVRYQRRGEPLLCTYSKALEPPPSCSNCQGPLSFEFQIMPQLLQVVGLGSDITGDLDWGSIYVFTCDRSCQINSYAVEHAQVLQFDAEALPEPSVSS